jgi:hypothetical protein
MRFDDFVFEFAFSASRTSTLHPKRGLRHCCPYLGTDDYLIEPVRVIFFRSSRLSSLSLWLRPSYVHSSHGISGSEGGTQLLNAFILCCIRCIRLSEMTMSWQAISRARILDGFGVRSKTARVTPNIRYSRIANPKCEFSCHHEMTCHHLMTLDWLIFEWCHQKWS